MPSNFVVNYFSMNPQIVLLPLLACFLISSTLGTYISPFKLKEVEYHGEDVGEPLILTPLLEKGKVKQARAAAKVSLGGVAKDVASYAGYLTVNKQYNSNLFFWFIPSTGDYVNDPVLLWLQGGPGSPSMYGLLMEHGPFAINDDIQLERREHCWTNNHSVIYIDSPVGTGFSFTKSEKGYATEQTQVGSELYKALQQFFQLFPELRKNDFYITGESYGGKYVPALAYTIHKNNPDAKEKINLKGIAIGNGYTDPVHQKGYAEYVYQLGLVDEETAKAIKRYEVKATELIYKKDFRRSVEMWGAALNEIRHTGVSYYNYLKEEDDALQDAMILFLNKPGTRRALHAGSVTFGSDKVYDYLREDMAKTIAPWFVVVANHYRVLLYSGQLDIIVAYPLTLNFLENVEFNGIHEYRKAQRKLWYVEREIAGYSKSGGNFTEVLVRDAGHMVPADQPKWAEDLIYRFTRNQPIH
ncbi:unnamed protein product [Acanthoscelides obtectus]|uniref:Carboxypeptidase n=1 Tax=Acanthoscelides obtectus TaxID=200917 RepID=A0A9P0L674_ACAOB|nr:unnamed protein product [Acanthoscelides obtectus]CAK1630920.1 hypothetical protein AOBTE_LOCUS6644 [Acanthoscelides obtectus]